MQIKFENIILRDMIESDIEDYVRWFTVEREWENWDAPWEKEDTDAEAELPTGDIVKFEVLHISR